MTQREKANYAHHLAAKMKSIADRLEREARSYDCTFPLSFVRELRDEANTFLKAK